MAFKFHPREKVPINFKRKIKGEVKSIFDGESRLLLVRPEDNLYRKSIVLPETLYNKNGISGAGILCTASIRILVSNLREQ